MSSVASQGEYRRVTRSASRAGASPAPSDGGASAAGERDTPSRTGRRTSRRSTPAQETGETGENGERVGNRGSTAYGARGKRLSATKMSLSDAERNPAEFLDAALQDAKTPNINTGVSTGNLSPVREGSEDTSVSSLESELGPRRPSGLNAGQAAAPQQVSPNAVEPTIHMSHSNSGRSVDQSFVQRMREYLPWHVDNTAASHANLSTSRFGSSTGRRNDNRGQFAGDWTGPEDGVFLPIPEVQRPRPWLIFLFNLIFCLVIIFTGLYLYQKSVSSSLASTIGKQMHSVGRESLYKPLEERLSSVETFVEGFLDQVLPGGPIAKPHYAEIDWFAASNDAKIDPDLTSPGRLRGCEALEKSPFREKFRAWVQGDQYSTARKCKRHTAFDALKPWTETDDSFCAPPGRGKLQLAVSVQRTIAPTELIIEHPKDALIIKGETPKQVELWAEIPNEATQNILINAPRAPDQEKEAFPQVHRMLEPDKSLPPTFVRLGQWDFDIYSRQHIQLFRIPIDMKKFNAHSDKFVIRVNSNWGNVASTCIFRVRLHGEDMSGQSEHLEQRVQKN